MPSRGSGDERSTDAIVGLTGGSDRLAVALDLLSADKGRKLFVSGVYRGVDVRQLLDLSQHSPDDLSCCVVLGYEADNTRGNAVETAAWMKEQGFDRSEEHTSELQSLMRISYAVFCLKKKTV